MKRIFILSAVLAVTAVSVQAQEEAPAGKWSTSSTPTLKASEFLFKNWSKSGNSMIDVTGTFFGNYKYTHPKYVWDNIADLAYGYAWQDLDNSNDPALGGLFETRRKSNDKIDLSSSLSWNAYKGIGASLTAGLKTQFGHGYEYEGIGTTQTETLVSSFFAPAYLTTALSFEYKKSDWSISFSFLTGKTTFVYNDSLLQNGYTYGVIQRDDDYLTNHNYTHAYFGLGSYVKAQYLKKDILPSLDLYARLELFYDYKKPGNMAWSEIDAGNFDESEYMGYEAVSGEWSRLQNMNWFKKRMFETDIDVELKLDYRFSQHIAANFALNLKYDTDFSGFASYGHWQLYQMFGLQVFFNWKK
ncbi:MAG: DUF3078 domain-containing protein [Bacteroidales bacterium]|nr:DUF3078 domain-containing protein [Bacteroidales bacterium]